MINDILTVKCGLQALRRTYCHATLAQMPDIILTEVFWPGSWREGQVMKKSMLETAETRRRIIKTASAELRRNGIQATGLAEVMAAAGLTHGGFYRHFESKDQLIAEACAAATESVVEVTEAAACRTRNKTGFQSILDSYLSENHRDNEADGCFLAALGSELARADLDTREAASEGFVKLIEIVSDQLRLIKPECAKARAIFALSAMIGAVTMSRIVTDPKLSSAILRDVKKQLANV